MTMRRSEGVSAVRRLALVVGPLLAGVTLVTPAPEGLAPEAWRLTGVTAWMVCWWLTEAVPLPATALLPIPCLPLLGIVAEEPTARSYAHPLIFLFLGGFILAGALERSGLHRRMALAIVRLMGRRLGGSPAGLVGGFMGASALLSMWISNTASAMLMFTLGVSLLESLEDGEIAADDLARFGRALMLGIAYGCSIGGVATLVGTPPNALLASFLGDSYGIELTMARWMGIGLPYTLLMLPLAWLWLTRYAFRLSEIDLAAARRRLDEEHRSLGRPGRRERFVGTVFVATAGAWVLRGLLVRGTGLAVSDSTIALVASLVLLAVPLSRRRWECAIGWETVERLPWGVLILFGGGLALAGAFQSTGLAAAIGAAVAGLEVASLLWVVAALTAVVVLLTELTSNTATAATFLPIVGAVAVGLGVSPLLLTVPVAMAASAAFMMPVATPPNAIVFAYDELRITHMMRSGAVLNLVSVLLILAVLHLLGPAVLGL